MGRSSPRRGQRSKESAAKVVVAEEGKVVKFGRKDLNPRVEETYKKNEEILEREEERGEEEKSDDKEAQGTGNEESEDESEGGELQG
ncbi:unnamed protein product [Eruca vesicaria subsp. sativa]|uniref:Uncharacterized protein n=1 Tax=Eruca vesicaria subsp. sativa TaxID=29727 RepID=A0ABC8LFH5_ERUVS|nr:unnamed protein product [Eruca vesicaria subsp. sativa]